MTDYRGIRLVICGCVLFWALFLGCIYIVYGEDPLCKYFVNVTTDIPLMKTVAVDDSTTVEVESGQYMEKNYQCSAIDTVDTNVVLTDISGEKITYPAGKVKVFEVKQ